MSFDIDLGIVSVTLLLIVWMLRPKLFRIVSRWFTVEMDCKESAHAPAKAPIQQAFIALEAQDEPKQIAENLHDRNTEIV